MTPEELQAIIDASGLSHREFAHSVLGVDDTMLRKWLTGDLDIPKHRARWLARLDRIEQTATGLVLHIAHK
jgi:DNA-binding transcriptional regulator YiaG